VREYLATHTEFEIDRFVDSKLGISVAPEGYLKRIR
jgi:cephalosporin hydroxylase